MAESQDLTQFSQLQESQMSQDIGADLASINQDLTFLEFGGSSGPFQEDYDPLQHDGVDGGFRVDNL